jgi:hypothetical protein
MLGYLNEILSSKPELVTTVEFEGVKYGLIPDFDKGYNCFGELLRFR